jgi:hypothetical protein
MPSVIITVPPFPNVPQLAGVPQLVRSLAFPPSPLPTLGTQASGPLWAANQRQSTWGIFDQNNNRVVTPDSVLNFDNRNEWRISDYAVQAGGFAPFNKVFIPFEVSVRLSKGGSLSDRSAFLQQIDAIAGDTNFYNVLTPEKTYMNVNITRYEVTRRGKEGAYFLSEVDIYFRQVNQQTAQYSSTAANTTNAQNAAATPSINQGNVQPTAVTQQNEELAFLKLLGSNIG